MGLLGGEELVKTVEKIKLSKQGNNTVDYLNRLLMLHSRKLIDDKKLQDEVAAVKISE